MGKYHFEIEGIYKDWGKIYLNNECIHYGSIISIVSENEEIYLSLNYNTKNNYQTILKKMGNKILSIPTIPDCLNKGYIYKPLIFSEDEFNQFASHVYLDDWSEIGECTQEDIQLMWLMTNPKRDSYISFKDLKLTIISNILVLSDGSSKSLVENLLDTTVSSIELFIGNNQEDIVAYMDFEGNDYEWNSFVQIDKCVYLKLDETYYASY